MTKDEEELLARLRECSQRAKAMNASRGPAADGTPDIFTVIDKAADKIESLMAERDALRYTLEQLGGKARLGGDCLGNSPPEFASCQRAFYLIADLAASALSNTKGEEA